MHPAREGLFIGKLRNEEFKINSKIILKTLVSLKRIVTFAPAKRENGGIKKEEYVHRHIELTAVLMQIRTNKKESKKIGRFE